MTTPSEINPVCQKCGLWKSCKSPFMPSAGATNPRLLVIGEAPGEEEDNDGVPFVGRSGTLLRNVIQEVGYDLNEEVRFTNVVRCRPPGNKIIKEAINHCSRFALEDIQEYEPEMVWLMGNSPLNAVLGETGISNWNGSVIQKDGTTYVPLFHPAYILRNMGAMDEWLDAMLKVIDGDVKEDRMEYVYPQSIPQVIEMMRFLEKCTRISYDTETSDLDPFNNTSVILSVSFAGIASDGARKSFSLPIDHPESWWDDDFIELSTGLTERQKVIDIVKGILRSHSGNIVGHNMKFDLMWTWVQFDQWYEIGGDTMLLSHLIDSRLGIHGLKRLAGVHLGMYEYEKELDQYKAEHSEADPGRGGSYAFIPLKVLLPYGAMDSEATLLLEDILFEGLSEEQKILYKEAILPLSETLARTQCNGMQIDDYIARRYEIIYDIVRKDIGNEILANKHVKRMLKDLQVAYDKLVVGDVDQYVIEGDKIIANRMTKNGKMRVSKRKRKIAVFNPGSSDQRAMLFFEYCKIPVLGKTKSGKDSTSAKLMRPLESKYPLLKDVRVHNLHTKMIGTYLHPARIHVRDGGWKSDDGKVRTSINQHGTRTGRTSSSQPFNAQNIPTPEKEPGTLLEILPIKNIFTHSYVNWDAADFFTMFRDGVVMSADYSGAELRCFASLADCDLMIAIHKSGLDFHRMTGGLALRLLNKKDVLQAVDSKKHIARVESIIMEIPKAVRYRYKWTNWTLLYGGTAYTLMNLYGMPEDEAKETVEIYYDVFPEVLQYADWCIEFAEDHGYIESPFGRRMYLPYINDNEDVKRRNKARREARNMPIQSAAGETTLIAMAIIDRELQKNKFRASLINTVHDSVMLDVPREEIHDAAALCTDVMENIQFWAGKYMPNIDFSWLKAPMKADVEVGSHYGSEMSIEEWEAIFC